MAAMKFTRQQQQVIDTRDKNILVSAAAGSGKTAVLVERIIRRITDAENPVDIDRLLIVTFTSAAAAQMRERISLAIEAKLYEEPENEHLQRQAAILHNAQITTIDSFCLFVIRNNFNDIGLDPAFRVGDEGEIRLMKQDAAEELFESCFAEDDGSFARLVESFGKSGSEKPLMEQMLKLYEFAMSLPWPREWLLERKKDYRVKSIGELENREFMKEVWKEVRLRLADARSLLERGLKICEEPDGPYMYAEMLEADGEQIEKLLKLCKLTGQTQEEAETETQPCGEQGRASVMQVFYEAIQRVGFPVLSRKKDESVSAEKREQVRDIRKSVKDAVQDIKSTYFYKSPQALLTDMQNASETVDTLIDVVIKFMDCFAQKKREKNIIDFADMEHFALDILVRKEGEEYTPTGAAAEYRRHFVEIMMDEYQDSNLVQEALLGSISGEREGRFDRFMVGDVKQSIYKFRLARPEIFMEKYERYSAKEQTDQCVRIDLKKNFRSRRQVLESTNFVFRRIMQKELGGVAYDEAAALYPGADYEEPGADRAEPESGDIYRTELLLYDKASETGRPGDAKEREAAMIAGKIRELVGTLPVTDKESGKLRPAAYRDIVILLRTNSGWDDVFVRVLTEAGIPAYAASKTGYFAAQEIQTILNLLRVIDNPRQDIPLFGVLKSVFGGFSEAELAYVKAWKEETESVRTDAGQPAAGAEENGKARTADDGSLYSRLEQFCGECIQAGKEEAAEPEYQPERMEREQAEIRNKWSAFQTMLSRYRVMAAYTPVGKLIRTILTDSGYLYAVSAMPGGGQRRANVEMLLARAADFEKTSYYGLFHFLRYMEQMERYQIDYGEASILDENSDTVRIMSIHKSKGLEFPVCIVAGLSKRFNMSDARETMLTDVELGLGVEYVNLTQRLRQNTLLKNVLAAKLKRDNLGEELRVLYVAMTRAKEKMILTAAVEDAEKLTAGKDAAGKEEAGKEKPGTQETEHSTAQEKQPKALSYGARLAASDYLDLLMPCVLQEQSVIDMTIVSENDLGLSDLKHDIQMSMREKRLLFEKDKNGGNCTEELSKRLAERFHFVYPHEKLRGLYTKTTVSELKKAGYEDFYDGAAELYAETGTKALIGVDGMLQWPDQENTDEPEPILPRFMQQEEKVSGTDRGSAYHRVMELLDLTAFLECPQEKWESLVTEQMERQQETGRLTPLYGGSVKASSVVRFLKSPLAGRMMRAQKEGLLYRERPFVLGIPATRLKDTFPEDETVLVQGIIDAYFEEDGKLVVVDYKTDRISKGKELADRYHVQLAYYEEALFRLTGKEVKEKILYSFALQEEILV